MSAVAFDDLPQPALGYVRKWLVCRHCGKIWMHDYVPYALGGRLTSACAHGAAERDMGCNTITEEQARAWWPRRLVAAKQPSGQAVAFLERLSKFGKRDDHREEATAALAEVRKLTDVCESVGRLLPSSLTFNSDHEVVVKVELPDGRDWSFDLAAVVRSARAVIAKAEGRADG